MLMMMMMMMRKLWASSSGGMRDKGSILCRRTEGGRHSQCDLLVSTPYIAVCDDDGVPLEVKGGARVATGKVLLHCWPSSRPS